MSDQAIFACGSIVSLLCLAFLGFSAWELRRLGIEAEQARPAQRNPEG